MTNNQRNKTLAKIVSIIDEKMPGRRVGSPTPEDCRPAAMDALQRLRDRLPDDLGLTAVRLFLQAHGERHDERFAMAFRREAIRSVLAREAQNINQHRKDEP